MSHGLFNPCANLNSAKTYDVIDKKKKALKLKEIGNDVFKKKDYENAEKFYSRGLEMNLDSRSLWTNRANCRNKMGKYKEALEDSVAALSIDPKCTKAGFLYSYLKRFDWS